MFNIRPVSKEGTALKIFSPGASKHFYETASEAA